ncbi:MAG: Trp biosynthesis-associated membrane protein [Propionibacteriaceae bacterium]
MAEEPVPEAPGPAAADPGTQPRRRGAWRRWGWAGPVVGGLLGLIASSQAWWEIASSQGEATITGSDGTGGLSQSLIVVVAAGLLLLLVLRRTVGRIVVAVLLGLAGSGVAVLGLWHPAPSERKVLDVLRSVTLADDYTVRATAWPWVYGLAGLLVVAGVLVVRLRRDPTGVDRFDRGPVAHARPDDDPGTVWKALDAGVDPTVDVPGTPVDVPSSDPGGAAGAGAETMDPDVLPADEERQP